MARKRSSNEPEPAQLPTRPRRQSAKRARMAPVKERQGDSSATSTGSVSVDSAWRSTPPGDQDMKDDGESSQSSVEDSDDDESESESDGSDRSEGREGSEGSNGEDVERLRAQRKPDMSLGSGLGSAGKLQERLKMFLPKMEEANALLEKDDTIEDVGEDEPHIEMNLGLGVLEEKKEGMEESEGESDDSETDGGEGKKEVRQKEKDVMGKLMGEKERQAGAIEEVG